MLNFLTDKDKKQVEKMLKSENKRINIV